MFPKRVFLIIISYCSQGLIKMTGLKAAVLSLLLLQVCVAHKLKRLKHWRTFPDAAAAPAFQPFFDNCEDITDLQMFTVNIILKILDELTKHLETVCDLESTLPLLPTIIGGNLWCDGNIPSTAEILLNYVLNRVDRDCQKLQGFHSIYIFTDLI